MGRLEVWLEVGNGDGGRRRSGRSRANTAAYDVNGNPVALPCTHKVFSLCLHSDMPTALANVQAARAVFDRYKDQA